MNGYDLIFVKKLKIDEMHDQLTWFIKNNTLNFVKKNDYSIFKSSTIVWMSKWTKK